MPRTPTPKRRWFRFHANWSVDLDAISYIAHVGGATGVTKFICDGNAMTVEDQTQTVYLAMTKELHK